MGKQERLIQVLVGRPKDKRLLERSTGRCEDINGTDLQEVVWGGTDWIDLA
jgi:hypothetical protein